MLSADVTTKSLRTSRCVWASHRASDVRCRTNRATSVDRSSDSILLPSPAAPMPGRGAETRLTDRPQTLVPAQTGRTPDDSFARVTAPRMRCTATPDPRRRWLLWSARAAIHRALSRAGYLWIRGSQRACETSILGGDQSGCGGGSDSGTRSQSLGTASPRVSLSGPRHDAAMTNDDADDIRQQPRPRPRSRLLSRHTRRLSRNAIARIGMPGPDGSDERLQYVAV